MDVFLVDSVAVAVGATEENTSTKILVVESVTPVAEIVTVPFCTAVEFGSIEVVAVLNVAIGVGPAFGIGVCCGCEFVDWIEIPDSEDGVVKVLSTVSEDDCDNIVGFGGGSVEV